MAGKTPPSTASLATTLAKSDFTALKRLIADAVRDGIKEYLNPINTQINVIEQSVTKLGKDVADQRVKMETMGNTVEKRQHVEDSLLKQIRLQEQTLCSLAWENSLKRLRLQDLTLPGGADLKQEITQLLSPLAEIPEEDFYYQIQAIYRMETQYTKRNSLPPEIHIKFKEREVRDAILLGANKNPAVYADKRIKILKDIPFIIRQKRQVFKPLAKQLIAKGIVFKWINPQGLQFKYRDQLFRLTSKKIQEEFLEKFGEDFKQERAGGETTKTKFKETVSQQKEKKESKKMELRQRKV